MTLLIDIQYFPSITLYKKLYNLSSIVFEQYEAYQKSGFRNRCRIAGAQGVVGLSVPLWKGRGQKTLTRDVKISNRQPWAARHWKTIMSCYSRSPWFDYYRADLEALYHGGKYDRLLDWDLACFEWSLRALDLPVTVGLTDSWRLDYDPGEVVDWRGRLRHGGLDPGRLPAGGGPGGGSAAEIHDAAGEGRMAHRYRQVFEERTGFIPNLSILDLLFCEGKQAIRYIRSS
ncbi:MAG TPA: WbqC family protein [Puia sp.]|nr:WbqC family protein [Puia sp.]